MAKILTFQTNTDTKIPVNRRSEPLDSRILNFASQPRDVVVNKDPRVAALSFPEAWRPFLAPVGALPSKA